MSAAIARGFCVQAILKAITAVVEQPSSMVA
jgi:hypothetical protein